MTTPYAIQKVGNLYPNVDAAGIAGRLNYSTYVNYERRYLYYEVAKAACTWMKTLIHSLEGLPPIEPYSGSLREVRRDMFIHTREQFALKSLVDFDDAAQKEILESPDFLRFTIVRNPYTRLVSAWRDKVEACAPGYGDYYFRIKGALPRSKVPDSFITFAEFVQEIAKQDLTVCNNHWRLQVEHTFFRAMNFNVIGRMETLRDAVAIFLDRAAFPDDKLPEAMNESTGSADYDQDLAARVFDLYRRDFTDLNYDRNSWRPPRKRVARGLASAAESKIIGEIAERNIIIDHLYGERDALRKKLSLRSTLDPSGRLDAYRVAGFDELFNRYISGIDGWLAQDEAAYLYGLAKAAAGGSIVELGSYRGRSTTVLAFGTISGAGLPVFAFEPHEPFVGAFGGEFGPLDRGYFMKTMIDLGLYHQVRLVNLPSEALDDRCLSPVALLWIDADHRYDAVKRDFEHWRGKLAEGAAVAFYEASDPESGPGRVVRELVETGEFRIEAAIGKMIHLRKATAA